MKNLPDTRENIEKALDDWAKRNGLPAVIGFARSASYYSIIAHIESGEDEYKEYAVSYLDLGLAKN